MLLSDQYKIKMLMTKWFSCKLWSMNRWRAPSLQTGKFVSRGKSFYIWLLSFILWLWIKLLNSLSSSFFMYKNKRKKYLSKLSLGLNEMIYQKQIHTVLARLQIFKERLPSHLHGHHHHYHHHHQILFLGLTNLMINSESNQTLIVGCLTFLISKRAIILQVCF